MTTNQAGYYEHHWQQVVISINSSGMGGAKSLISLTSLLEAESTDFVASEKIQQQLYIEVEGIAPGDSLTGFTQDDGAQQTALNCISNVPQVGRKRQW